MILNATPWFGYGYGPPVVTPKTFPLASSTALPYNSPPSPSRSKSYARFRKENEKFGRMRVVQDLKAKGVHGDIIESVVDAAYSDVNEEQTGAPVPAPQAHRQAGGPEAGSACFSRADARRLRQPRHFSRPEEVGRGRRNSAGSGERSQWPSTPAANKNCYRP
jgi:RecX family